MIVGHGNLLKLFPDFKEDIQENGIDLRIGELYTIHPLRHGVFKCKIGCINDKKYIPTYYPVKREDKDHYVLEPRTFYFGKIDRPIHIPKGYIQQYYLRSSFSRCGLILTDAIGDSGFKGTLMFGLYNSGYSKVHMGFNERIIQAVTIKTDGTALEYDGDYQNDKIYKEQKG